MAKGPIIFGLGAALALFGFLWGKKRPAKAAPGIPEEEIPGEEIPGEVPPEEVEQFTYVSEINLIGCRFNGYAAKGLSIDVKNTGNIAARCQLRVYVNEFVDFTYAGWRDTGLTLLPLIQPGEVKTFEFCVFLLRSYNFSFLARIAGDPGTIEGGRFSIRRYA